LCWSTSCFFFWFRARGEVKNHWSSYFKTEEDCDVKCFLTACLMTSQELSFVKQNYFLIIENSLNKMIMITQLKYLQKSLLGL
jgi:hypothetical protein